MPLSDYEKQLIINELDVLDAATRTLVLASLGALAEWLANVLYAIYLKLKDTLIRLWNWLRSRY
ncbi:MAG: hypothetical protein EAZ78_14955 [Oscillatoriales cyanobacterium]|nr:MAG: hypothetical protein EAZ78_14955 [Oscillatoriales cyanobacterium]TAF69757.1 MAG: hypothetical protein EAZ59_07555 [Oscillatoriales cyanobacterium]